MRTHPFSWIILSMTSRRSVDVETPPTAFHGPVEAELTAGPTTEIEADPT
ncbi:MAG: hypothetical protein IPP63_19570 [Chloracidobacterium sp.]|nr:hypothetical protein [Chloracidobacterium sp.]